MVAERLIEYWNLLEFLRTWRRSVPVSTTVQLLAHRVGHRRRLLLAGPCRAADRPLHLPLADRPLKRDGRITEIRVLGRTEVAVNGLAVIGTRDDEYAGGGGVE